MRFFYEDRFLYWVDRHGKIHPAKKRSGSESSQRCPDCDLRGALTEMGHPVYCGECRERVVRGKRKCTLEWCANGCEVCGGTGRVPR